MSVESPLTSAGTYFHVVLQKIRFKAFKHLQHTICEFYVRLRLLHGCQKATNQKLYWCVHLEKFEFID